MRKSEKLQVFELLKKGLSISEIHKITKVAERTLYRWSQEFNDQENKIKTEIEEVKVKVESKVELELEDINFQEDWVSFATKSSVKGCLINGKIAEKLSEIMLNELEQPDLNFRAISCLSASIGNHFKLQRDFGMFYLLDINKAIKMIESEGYIVMEDKPEDPAAAAAE